MDYAYDGSGNLVKVSNANTGTVYWQSESGVNFPVMNALGQMQAITLGGALDVERLHDAATGAVTSITSGPNGSGSVLNLTTSYNASGSRLSLNDLNAGLNESYRYDSFQRLKRVTRTAAGGGSSSGFTYGKVGQFTLGPAGAYSYGAFPKHAPSSTTENGTTTDYSYNADGDRTRARLPQVTWNALGQAHTIQTGNGTTLTLTYGPDGGLIDNSGLGGGRYLGAFLKQTDPNDWSARIIVQGRVIAVVKDSGGSVSTAYLLQGPLGSTAALATGGGSLIRRIATGAWGQFVHPATGTGSVSPASIAPYTTVTYTGHELIAGAGLINMGARLYDPATGLFMSPDPTVAYPYNSQDLNQYAYVNDNPLTYVDPFGYFKWWTFWYGAGEVVASSIVIGTAVFLSGATDGLAAPLVAGIALTNADQFTNGIQNIIGGFHNQLIVDSPLTSLVGETNNQAAEATLTAGEIIMEPGKGILTISRYMVTNGALSGIKSAQGGGGGSVGGMSGGGTRGGGMTLGDLLSAGATIGSSTLPGYERMAIEQGPWFWGSMRSGGRGVYVIRSVDGSVWVCSVSSGGCVRVIKAPPPKTT